MASHPPSVASSASVGATGRRQFTPEFKRHLVELTLHPGASVAGIALDHQLNVNQLFKWRREYLQQRVSLFSVMAPGFFGVMAPLANAEIGVQTDLKHGRIFRLSQPG